MSTTRASVTHATLRVAASVAFLSAYSCTSFAAEAYIQDGVGARNKALAGAGVASTTDSTAVSLNPAGLTHVDNQVSGSISVLDVAGGFSSWGTGGLDPDGTHISEAGTLPIPNFAANWHVNWGLVDSIAFSGYGNGGVNSQYPAINNGNCPFPGMTGVYCGGVMGIQLTQIFYSVAFAKQIFPGFSVGVAPILAYQSGRIRGAGAFAGFSSDPANFSDRGYDSSWGFGARAGIEWQILPHVTLGVAGNTPIDMSPFDKYRGLLAGGGDFDIPPTVQAGIAFELSEKLKLMVDYKRIWFSSVASASNPSTNLLLGNPFGADDGAGYGVRDMNVIKVGLEYQATPGLTLRGGYSYNSAPIGSADADLNIMTLGVVQHHITGGLKYAVNDHFDVELAAMYAPEEHVLGTELGAPGRNVEIFGNQAEITGGVVYHFGVPDKAPLK